MPEYLDSEELTQLRLVSLDLEACQLEAGKLQHQMNRLVFEIEKKHGLLVGDNRIDLMTGKITQGKDDGSV